MKLPCPIRVSSPLVLALVVSSASACSKATTVEATTDGAPEQAAPSSAVTDTAETAPATVDASAGGSLPGKEERLYRGTIDKTLALVMRLTRNGSFLEGRYFYDAQGVDLALSGAMSKDGVVTLSESPVEPGAKTETGTFEGAFAADGTFSGTWSDPKKTRSLAFVVTPSTPTLGQGPVTLVKKKMKYTARALKAVQGKTTCEVNVTYPEAVGAFDGKVEASVNKKLRPVGLDPTKCDEPMSRQSDYKVHMNRGGILSVRSTYTDYVGGAAHPNNGMTFLTVRVPSGDEVKLKSALKPSAKAAFASAVEPQVAKAGLEATGTEMLRGQLAVENADFAVEEQGLRLFAYNGLPHAMKGASSDGFFVPFGAVVDTIVESGPLAAHASKAKPLTTDAGAPDASVIAATPDAGAAVVDAGAGPATDRADGAAPAAKPGLLKGIAPGRKRADGL